MKQKNVYKQNERYFTEGEWIKILGAALVALAVVIYFFGRGYIAYILMCASAPAGVFLFFFGASRRASDADIERYIALATEGVETVSENERVWLKRLDKSFSPLTVAGYSYDGDILLARAKDGTVRSTAYEKSVLYALKDALYISTRRISLIAEEKEDRTQEIPFDEIVEMELSSKERYLVYEKKTYTVKDTRLYLHLTDGRELSLSAKDDLVAEEFIERIMRNIKKQKNHEA